MEKKSLKVYTQDQRMLDATLLIQEDQEPVYIQLVFEGFDSGKIAGEKLYYCMQDLHRMLDAAQIKLLCNGFRYDVHPSGMGLSMGHAVKAYKLIKGVHAKEWVSIFDPTDDINAIVSVEEQEKFYKEWSESFRQ